MSSVFLTSILKYDKGYGLAINRELCLQQWEEMYKPGNMCMNVIKKCVETPKASHDDPLVVNRELCSLQWEEIFKPGKYTKWKMCNKYLGRCVKKALAKKDNRELCWLAWEGMLRRGWIMCRKTKETELYKAICVEKAKGKIKRSQRNQTPTENTEIIPSTKIGACTLSSAPSIQPFDPLHLKISWLGLFSKCPKGQKVKVVLETMNGAWQRYEKYVEIRSNKVLLKNNPCLAHSVYLELNVTQGGVSEFFKSGRTDYNKPTGSRPVPTGTLSLQKVDKYLASDLYSGLMDTVIIPSICMRNHSRFPHISPLIQPVIIVGKK